jgi:molecular chaperone IbpA
MRASEVISKLYCFNKEDIDMTGFDFSPLFRSTVGFDRINRLMEGAQVPRGDGAYPPYNIEKTGENDYRISVAVAGFSEEDIDISVKDNTLTITGKAPRDGEDEAKYQFLHRGIAGRAFRLNFALADAVTVNGAELANGLLHLALERIVPEEAKPRTIAINTTPKPKVLEGQAA